MIEKIFAGADHSWGWWSWSLRPGPQ